MRYLATVLAVLIGPSLSQAQGPPIDVLFAEDFDSIPLTTSPTFDLPNAWSPDGPSGWDVVREIDPAGGTPEFQGWTFWNEQLWDEVGGGLRPFFRRSRGAFAVADADLWNDPLQPDVEPAV